MSARAMKGMSAWVLTSVGYFAGTCVLYMLDASLTQPHPIYLSGTWGTYEVQHAFYVACLVTASLAVIIPVDLAVQRQRRIGEYDRIDDYDMTYRPTTKGFAAARKARGPRIVLIIGAMIIISYFAMTALALWETSLIPHGLTWPPNYLFYAAVLAWGTVWIADCLTRPRLGAAAGAVMFTLWMAFILLPLGTGITRE